MTDGPDVDVRRYSLVGPAIALCAWAGLLGAVLVEVTGSSWPYAVLQVLPVILGGLLFALFLGLFVSWVGRGLVVLGTWLLGIVAMDLFAWLRAKQGLWVLVEIHSYEGWQGVARSLAESGIGVPSVILLLCLPMIAGVGAAWGWREVANWWPSLTTQRPYHWLVAAALLATFGQVLVPGARATTGVFATFYGPNRMAARFLAAGAPPSIRLPGPVPDVGRHRTTTTAAGPTHAQQAAHQREVSVPSPDAAQTIVLVVIESLRHDAVDPATTPNLARFAAQSVQYPQARAAANATHPSWYSLFFSRYSLWWHRFSQTSTTLQTLPPPLRALVDAGYELHVRSAAGLNYYRVADATFGTDRSRATSYVDAVGCYEAGHERRRDRDRCAADGAVQVLQKARKSGKKTLLVVLFDASHYPYDPPDTPAFSPVANEAALKAGAYEDMTAVRNRYRSALRAIDTEFGKVTTALKPLQERGVITIVTGDHGEEFGEHGKLAHDSELCDVQTRVPLLIRGIKGLQEPGPRAMGSHVDVLPTVLQAVGLAGAATRAVDGVPLQFGARSWAFVVHTSAGSPFLVAVQTVEETLELSLSDRHNVAKVTELFLLQTYPTGANAGLAVAHSHQARAAIAQRYGPALKAVFGVRNADILRKSPRRLVRQPARYAVTYERLDPPSRGPADRTWTVPIAVTNRGNVSWLHNVSASYHWLDEEGTRIPAHFDNRRTSLPRVVHPGERVEVQLQVAPPPCPKCVQLECDLVVENVTWLSKVSAPGPVIQRSEMSAP